MSVARSQRPIPSVFPHLPRPRGVLAPAVREVGPEHFAIVSVDCAKRSSALMMATFFGEVLLEPQVVEHNRVAFAEIGEKIRVASVEHSIKKVIVAIEQTGRYHLPPKTAFQKLGFEVRLIHPYITHSYRKLRHPGVKTDFTDLDGVHQGTINGFALVEPQTCPRLLEIQNLARHRRDLVEKNSKICCQMREHINIYLPGFDSVVSRLWESPAALAIALHYPTPIAIREADLSGLSTFLKEQQISCRSTTLDKILRWASSAPDLSPGSQIHQRISRDLDQDRRFKAGQIHELERDLASLLVGTDYLRLLSIPGINVVSAAEFAGEAGLITSYPMPNQIKGRAGIHPSQYQSANTDLRGRLVRSSNRRLRASIMRIADNLTTRNRYFAEKSQQWRKKDKEARSVRVKVADRFTRIAFHLVAGRQVFNHPCSRDRDYALDKIVSFHHRYGTAPSRILEDTQTAIEQLPSSALGEERDVLQERLNKMKRRRSCRTEALGEVLTRVLADLTSRTLESGD